MGTEGGGSFLGVKQPGLEADHSPLASALVKKDVCLSSVGGHRSIIIRRCADMSLTLPVFLFAPQPKEFFLDGLKKLEQRSHKCVELRGNM
jgi:hypothetical protein